VTRSVFGSIALIGALLVSPAAHAGLIDALTDEQRQVQICADAASPHEREKEWSRAAGVWEACAGEAERLGYADAVRPLRDQAAVVRALADAEPLREADPNRWALAVLAVAADQESIEYPTDAVALVFREWARTEAGKARLAQIRTVTVHWDGKSDAHAAQVFRRYVEDQSLRWAEPGAPDVGVIVFARIRTRDLEPRSTSRMGSLARTEATFDASKLRLPQLDRSEDGFVAVAATESATAADAREEALQEACRRAAARVLKQVLRIAVEQEEAP
jgi:hypothetical protein